MSDLQDVLDLIAQRRWEDASVFGVLTGHVEPLFTRLEKALRTAGKRGAPELWGPTLALMKMRETGHWLDAKAALSQKVVQPLLNACPSWIRRATGGPQDFCDLCPHNPRHDNIYDTAASIPADKFKVIIALGYDPRQRRGLTPEVVQQRFVEAASQHFQFYAETMALAETITRSSKLTPEEYYRVWRESIFNPPRFRMFESSHFVCGSCALDVKAFLEKWPA